MRKRSTEKQGKFTKNKIWWTHARTDGRTDTRREWRCHSLSCSSQLITYRYRFRCYTDTNFNQCWFFQIFNNKELTRLNYYYVTARLDWLLWLWIGNRDLGLGFGFGIEDWGLGLGIRIGDWGLGIGDWDWGLGLGIGIGDWGLWLRIGIKIGGCK